MNEQMEFPETFEEFAKEYGFKDDVYTNGSDLIQVFRVKQWLEHDNKLRRIETDTAYECGKHANRALDQEPCEDAISRQAVINAIANTCFWLSSDNWEELVKCIDSISPVNPQESKTWQFAKWVADEIFDEENWEYNKDAFAEIACRKLAKLGIVRAKGDEWELIEPQESEE